MSLSVSPNHPGSSTKRYSQGLIAAGLYVGTVFAANWAIGRFGVVPVGFGLLAPAGVYFAGLAFTLRDLTHEALGRRAVLLAILLGAAFSAFVSPQFAVASGVAFLLSELADYAVYTPLREKNWLSAVALSDLPRFGPLERLARCLRPAIGRAAATSDELCAVLLAW